MARSLTVNNEEKPSTSVLLNAFLVIAFGCLLLASFANASPSSTDATSSPISTSR
ncbi:MAG: hypothetical protein JXB39_03960 [Deltaproteobacteria bacterium]|nr:hypothetical protein [Deltaproteobacteria bacterium]